MLVEQRSQEWFDMRRGKITSSEIHKIMGGKGDSLSETAKTYLLEKACEFYGGHGNSATGAAVAVKTSIWRYLFIFLITII